MRLPRVLLAVPLLAAGAFLGRVSDSLRAAPRPTPGAVSLLGGFTAIAVQVLWQRADQAVVEHREDDAHVAFAAISELEPQLISSGEFIARAIGFNMAEGHKDPAVRWSLGREGWRVLCRTVEGNPGVAGAYGVRGRYALLRLDGDPAMRQGFIRDIDPAGPAEQARRDCEEALRLRPQWIEPWHLAGLASMRRAEEHLAAGRFEEAGSCFRREIETLRHTIESWRADGSPSLAESIDVTTETVQVAETLAAICAMAPAERSAAYDDLRRRAPDAGLPALPRR